LQVLVVNYEASSSGTEEWLRKMTKKAAEAA